MKDNPDSADSALMWRHLVDVAKRGAEASGYRVKRIKSGQGSNVVELEKDGEVLRTAIRTSRDRWFAFQPLNNGADWKTLDDVDAVLVAALDVHYKQDPRKIEVYLFSADDVRQHFDQAYKARIEAGKDLSQGFGMWVALDQDDRGLAASVGSGIAGKHKPIAVFPLGGDAPDRPTGTTPLSKDLGEDIVEDRDEPSTIGQVLAWARTRIAELAGVKLEAVKLDLKVEY